MNVLPEKVRIENICRMPIGSPTLIIKGASDDHDTLIFNLNTTLIGHCLWVVYCDYSKPWV